MNKLIIWFLLSVGGILLFGGCSARCADTPPQPVQNVIYMIGDGMGLAQVSAMMIDGGYASVNLERAEAVGLVKTYSANNRVTDSAAAGTALATGVKTNNSYLGIDPDGNPHRSVMEAAIEDGYKAGIVVTCRIQHATPGAFYGHVFNRNSYDSIAVQFVGSGIDVAMGGGSRYFDPEIRTDGRDLFAELRSEDYDVVTDLADVGSNGKIVAVLADKDMAYSADGRGDYLPEATAKALEILGNNSSGGPGFFLMVEGSLIDYAGHDHLTDHVMSETRDFDKAVGVAFDYADSHPGTLVIVLADHETGGLSIASNEWDYELQDSGVSYCFSTGGHTGTMVPVYAYGAGAENFTGIFDNTDIPKIISKLLLGTELTVDK